MFPCNNSLNTPINTRISKQWNIHALIDCLLNEYVYNSSIPFSSVFDETKYMYISDPAKRSLWICICICLNAIKTTVNQSL